MNGTTGESLCLTVSERKQLAEEWIRVARGRSDILHVRHRESILLRCSILELHGGYFRELFALYDHML